LKGTGNIHKSIELMPCFKLQGVSEQSESYFMNRKVGPHFLKGISVSNVQRFQDWKYRFKI